METVRDIMSKEFVALEGSQSAAELIGQLKENATTQACILNDGEPHGIFSAQSLLKSRVDVARLKLAKLATPVPHLAPQDDLLHAATALHDANAAMLPVVENGKLVGVVHSLEVLKRLWNLPEIANVTVQQIRHPEPMTIREEEGIDSALSKMHDLHIDRLPVIDEHGKVSGFLSYKEVLENYYAHRLTREYGQKPRTQTRAFEADRPDVPQLPVRNFMNTTILSIPEEAPLRKVIEEMVLHQAHSMLILEDRRPRGMVTHKAILEAAINSQVPENEKIVYVGLEKLEVDSYERLQIAKIASRHFEKLQRMAKNDIELTVHVKERSKSGDRHRYSVRLRVTYPGSTVPATQALAWNVRTALQEGFSRLESNLSSQYKRNKRENFAERKIGREMPRSDALPS